MKPPTVASIRETWVVVAAVATSPGEKSTPVALAAIEIATGHLVECGAPRLLGSRRPLYPTGPQVVIVTVQAQALVATHLALDWRLPERIIDLLVEFRNLANGRPELRVGGLPGALLWFGRPSSGGHVTGTSPQQMRRRLAAVSELFASMRPTLDLGRALLRGRYMCAVARIEATGVPVDQTIVARLAGDWRTLRGGIVDVVDQGFGVYRGDQLDQDAFLAWITRNGIAWPRLDHGRLDLSEDAFREMARAHPEVRPLKELMATLRSVDPAALTVGRDGRNRTPLRPFASRTGRNQPPAKASALGTTAWLRHLIKPLAGTGLAMIDWQQQEFAIAAALSGDIQMQTAYKSGDPYLALAVTAGAAPSDATVDSHGAVRERYKACALGLQYGMGAERLARQIATPVSVAAQLMARHKASFPRFWSWSDAVETHALLHREQTSVFGWRVSVGADPNLRALRNFPMQANGAEMLRLACCLVTEAGIKVCAPNHDALLIEAPLDRLDEVIASTQHLMAEASAIVLEGFALRTSVRVVRAPDRWTEQRGRSVWDALLHALAERDQPVRRCDATCSPANTRPISYYVSNKKNSHGTD
jgi:hypothetical protein